MRRRTSTSSRYKSNPPTVTVPLVGRVRPDKQESSVVFPDPFGPDKMVISPAFNPKEQGDKAGKESNFLLISAAVSFKVNRFTSNSFVYVFRSFEISDTNVEFSIVWTRNNLNLLYLNSKLNLRLKGTFELRGMKLPKDFSPGQHRCRQAIIWRSCNVFASLAALHNHQMVARVFFSRNVLPLTLSS